MFPPLALELDNFFGLISVEAFTEQLRQVTLPKPPSVDVLYQLTLDKGTTKTHIDTSGTERLYSDNELKEIVVHYSQMVERLEILANLKFRIDHITMTVSALDALMTFVYRAPSGRAFKQAYHRSDKRDLICKDFLDELLYLQNRNI